MTTRLTFASLLLLAACSSGAPDQPAKPPEIPVRVASVTRAAVTMPIIATGTFGAKEEVQLGFKVGGVIQRITVDPGQTVRAGQLLAELRLDEANAAVARTGATSDNAEQELARARRLYTDSVIPLAQLEAREAAARVAEADLSAARFNYQYARIVAPAAGVVLERKHEPGELVNPGAAVLVLASQSRGNVLRVGLADRDLVRVEKGDSASVRFDAIPGRVFSGVVSEVGRAAEPGTGTYLVDIQLRNTEGLVSDLVGHVEIHAARGESATLVPLEALLEADGDQGAVYLLAADGKTVERRPVRIGFLAGDRVAIAGGLDSNAKVVTHGAAYVRDGAAVQVVP
jgi:multidrug efflux system membrane fusion protein